MNETQASNRGDLVRTTVVFQLKLMADGFRDLVLVPVSLVAALVGLLRGGDEPEREFNQVIEFGRGTEQWINLFGNHDNPDSTNSVASIDAIFSRVEETLKQQYKAGQTSESAQEEIDEALQAAHREAMEKQSEK
jgi:hypothetical protein